MVRQRWEGVCQWKPMLILQSKEVPCSSWHHSICLWELSQFYELWANSRTKCRKTVLGNSTDSVALWIGWWIRVFASWWLCFSLCKGKACAYPFCHAWRAANNRNRFLVEQILQVCVSSLQVIIERDFFYYFLLFLQ